MASESADSREAVELGRAVMVASAYRTPTSAVQVHVLRLRGAFERAGVIHRLKYVLGVLASMREVQELSNGFWFPTPLRRIALDGCSLIVGPHPTAELRRHFPNVRRAGFGRFTDSSVGQALPSQELCDWSGLTITDTIAWTASVQAAAKHRMGPTVHPDGAQVFCGSAQASWVCDPRLAIKTDSGLVLCRAPMSSDSWRYFWGEIRATKIVAENELTGDLNRIQFGLAALGGRPVPVTVQSRGMLTVFRIPGSLPVPERRLMLALGTRDLSLPGRAFSVHGARFGEFIATTLKALGCELRPARG